MTITTLNLISKQTVGAAGAASVTFSNIPQTYTDLKVVVSARVTTSATYEELTIVINGVSTNLSTRYLYALSGTGTGSGSYASGDYRGIIGVNAGATATASTFGSSEIYITNYASTTTYKSISGDGVGENNATSTVELIAAALNSSNSAITQIGFISPTSANFVQYSTFTLYGVSSNTTTQNASVPYALGGNIITTDGSYWYHAFTSSGTFTPLKSISANCLVIAGGGGGGQWTGGGGGAGGVVILNAQSFTTSQVITVGAGGAAGNHTVPEGLSGSNSQIASLTAAIGGGGGAGYNGGVGGPFVGGSGGGGTTGGASLYGANGTVGQGNAGGNGYANNPFNGGGGGGYSSAGGTASAGGAGAGGSGLTTYSSWASATGTGVSGYYAGGGGGGVDNAGGAATAGGGAGTTYVTAGGAGTANTGGGGGGRGGTLIAYQASPIGGLGGSGIVIVRYAV